MTSDTTDPAWSSPAHEAIGRAILDSGHDELIPREIASVLGRDPSNVKDDAEEMVSAGLLERREPTRPQSGPGRRAQWAYAVLNVEALRRLLALRPDATLRKEQHLVFADLSSANDLAEVLADPEHTKGAAWFALSDGDPQEYMIAFEGEGAVGNARQLVSVLTAANIRCRRAHISEVGTISRLASASEDEARAARAVRMRQQTRRAAG